MKTYSFFFLSVIFTVLSPFSQQFALSSSLSDTTSLADPQEYSIMRIWFCADPPTSNDVFKNSTIQIISIGSGSRESYIVPVSLGPLQYADIDISTTMWCVALCSSSGSILNKSTYIRCTGGDSSKFHHLSGTWDTSMYLEPEKFESESLTPLVINQVLAGYYPFRNSNKNGYVAYGLLKTNVLDQYKNDWNALDDCGHYTFDANNKQVFVTANQKIAMLKKQYGSIDEKTRNFGGSGGLMLAIFILLGLVASVCFSLFFFKKKNVGVR